MPRTRKPARKAPIQIEGESFVKATKAEVPVAPPKKRSRAAKTPMPVEAMDHRVQVVGTDELKRGRKSHGR